MTIKERILSYLDTTGKVKAEFYKAIGASPSNFKGAGKNSALSNDKIAKTLTLYPDLSPDWLLSGIGEMIRTPGTSSVPETQQTLEDKLLTILNGKDKTIREQAEEIGRLKQRIEELEKRLQKTTGDVCTGNTANVG